MESASQLRLRLSPSELVAFWQLARTPMTLSTLAEKLGWKEPNASATVSGLVAKGLVATAKRNEKISVSESRHASRLFFLAQKHDQKTLQLLAGDSIEIISVIGDLYRANENSPVPIKDIIAWTGFSIQNAKRRMNPMNELGWLLAKEGKYKVGEQLVEDFARSFQDYICDGIARKSKATHAFAFCNQVFIKSRESPGKEFQEAGMPTLERLGARIMPGPDYWVASIGKNALPKPSAEEQVAMALLLERKHPGQKYADYAALAISSNKAINTIRLQKSARKYLTGNELEKALLMAKGIEYSQKV